MAEEGFYEIGKDIVLQKDQLKYAESNPEGLTKEGCEKRMETWKRYNRYIYQMYAHMLKVCKTFTTSGKTVEGDIVYARDNGKITWTSKVINGSNA